MTDPCDGIKVSLDVGEAQAEEQDGGDETPRQRVRILYAKEERIKFISHQDEFRAWERALRRSGLPLLYKRGFNPQPHIQFASPLGVGFTGLAEPVDITFAPPVPLPQLRERLAAALPPGLAIRELIEVPVKTPALQNLLIGADYTIRLYAEADGDIGEEIRRRIDDLLQKDAIWRERQRKGKRYRYNLRPLILELAYTGHDAEEEEAHLLTLRVQQRSGATGRPDEVIAALGLDDFPRSLCRQRLYFEHDPEDGAIFAAYPPVGKEDIAEQAVRGSSRSGGQDRAPVRRPKGRTIAERAADEFD